MKNFSQEVESIFKMSTQTLEFKDTINEIKQSIDGCKDMAKKKVRELEKNVKSETNEIGYLHGVCGDEKKGKGNVTSSSIPFNIVWYFESYYYSKYLKKLKLSHKKE